MGDENGGQTSFLVKIQKKAEDRLAGFPVQVAGRLVGQKDGRVVQLIRGRKLKKRLVGTRRP